MREASGAGAAQVAGVLGDHARPSASAPQSAVRPWDRRCTLASLVVLAVYLLALWSLPTDVFWSPDEGAKVLQMKALGWQDGLRLEVVYPGQRHDPGFQFYPAWPVYPQPAADGSVVLHWPIWFTTLSLLPYQFLGITGLYLIPLLAGLGTAMLSGMLAWRLRPGLAPLTILLVGLATPVLFYSVLFWEHTLVVFLGLVALWQLLHLPAQSRPWRSLLVAGACLLGATALKTEMAVYALCLAIAAASALILYHRPQLRSWLGRGWRDDIWRAVAAGATLALLAWLLFASPLAQAGDGVAGPAAAEGFAALPRAPATTAMQVGYGLGDLAERGLASALGRTWFYGFDAESGASTGQVGFVGVVLCLIGGALLAARALRRGEGGPGVGHWLLLGGSVLVFAGALQVLWFPERFRFVHAIFLPAPLMVLAALFLPVAFRRWGYAGALLALLAGIYLAVGTVVLLAREAYLPFAHPEWGARYLLLLYPLLVVCALVGIAEAMEGMRTGIGPVARLYPGVLAVVALALALAGVAFSMSGLAELHVSKQDLAAYQAAAAATGRPVVTDLPWLPSALAPYYATHELYVVDGEHNLGQWLDEVGGEVQEFAFVGFQGPDPGALARSNAVGEGVLVQDQGAVRGLLITEMRTAR